MKAGRHELSMFLPKCLVLAFVYIDYFIAMSAMSYGATYYVRTDGNNSNAGTGPAASQAWATVAAAVTKSLSAGDIIYVRTGTYVGTISPNRSGAVNNPIRFIADTNGAIFGTAGAVNLQATSGNEVFSFKLDDYLEFRGFRVIGDGVSKAAIEFDKCYGCVLDKCEIYNAGSDGVRSIGSNNLITIVNCLIRNNLGNGVYVSNTAGSNVIVRNSTIVSNSGGGVSLNGVDMTVINSIIANNSGVGINRNSGTFNRSYNLVFGNGTNYAGTTQTGTEIVADPQFVSASNYRLRIYSPAVDSGQSMAGIVLDDLDYRVRPYNGTWDMGCFEHGPMAHWKLDETSGSVASDSSGFGRHGSLSGHPAWFAMGIRNGAFDFETTDGVDRFSAGTFDVTGNSLSLVAWVRQEDPMNDGRIIMKSNGNATSNESWGLTVDEYGEVDFRVTAGGAWDRVQASAAVIPGRWYFLVGTYDGTMMRLYLDGILIQSKSHSVGGNLTANSSHTVTLGDSPTGSRAFDGVIDDARIYSISLTQNEISKLFGLRGHWKFNEGTGIAPVDSSGFANPATLVGANWTSDCTGKTAVEFNGSGNTATTNSSFKPPATGAVAFWMRASGTPAVRQMLFGINDNWKARIEPTGMISFDLGATPSAGNEPFSTPVVDNQDRWYHIVAQFNDVTDAYEVYVNGELTASGISPVNLVSQSSGTLTFGTRTGSNEYWQGALRDFRIYDRRMTSHEIAEASGLLAHWKLDELSGSVAVDSGTLKYDADYVGSPTLGVESPNEANNGTAVELNGISQYVNSNTSLLNNLPTFAMSIWVMPIDTFPDISLLGQNGLIELGIDTATDQLDFWTSNGGTVSVIQQLPLSEWSHVVVVGDGNGLRIYINGIEVASGGNPTANYGANSSKFRIGEGVLSPTGDFFEGTIDDVHIFARTLCPEEVMGIYQGGRPKGVRIIRWIEVR